MKDYIVYYPGSERSHYMGDFEYYIDNNQWKFSSSEFCGDILGVLISVDKKEYYSKINEELQIRDFSSNMQESIITLLKHGIPKNVKEYYLTYVESPLREFCDFHYIELTPTHVNCENINKIISTSCLPVDYLTKLIEGNKDERIH